MGSAVVERAITEASQCGKAILKFISPNDAGATGAHQAGFLLPKKLWQLYTPHPPTPGSNQKHDIKITWQDGRITDSTITWYGAAKSEYRLTRFGRDFPWLTPDSVGNLFVLIPRNIGEFSAYVFDREEDIEDILSVLGVEPFDRWAVYQPGAEIVETEDDCLRRKFIAFSQALADFPTGREFSDAARSFIQECMRNFSSLTVDEALIKSFETEYGLFKTVERQLCQPDIVRLFRDVDDFLKTANTILNRRKSRAGRSLENHVDFILTEAGISHTIRPDDIEGRPDLILPSREAYLDASFPTEKLMVVGIKTTCKDRWRQVLEEGPRVPHKHILTLQPGISSKQLDAMNSKGITLIIPNKFRSEYPEGHPIKILSIEDFIENARQLTA